MMNMFSFLTGLFSDSKVVDTALGIVDKVTGTDWTPEQKAKFVLDYQAATKHQSPTRRFIATMIAVEQGLLILTWIVASILFRGLDVAGAGLLAGDVSEFLQSNINVTMNVIVAFYFVMNIKK